MLAHCDAEAPELVALFIGVQSTNIELGGLWHPSGLWHSGALDYKFGFDLFHSYHQANP